MHMTTQVRQWVAWTPRIFGLVVAAFLGLFALDAFSDGSGFAALPAFAIHLVPALLVAAVALVSWRYPALGAVTFIGLAILYAWSVPAHVDWVVVISGPLLLVGLLFLWSWRQERTKT